MKIIIPIAGRGSRFKNVAHKNPAYQTPKPLIIVNGKPMVWWALESLPFIALPGRPSKTAFVVQPKDLIFIALAEHDRDWHISKVLHDLFGSDCKVILIPEVTRGAAETAMAAERYVKPNEAVLITDSDHIYDGEPYYQRILSADSDVAGIIPVFKPPQGAPKWSYTLFDNDGRALAVAEKDPELAARGAYANIGAYYFSRAQTFFNLAKNMIERNQVFGEINKQEFYIAPLYQKMLNQGLHVQVAHILQMHGLGTPEDLELFLKKKSKSS